MQEKEKSDKENKEVLQEIERLITPSKIEIDVLAKKIEGLVKKLNWSKKEIDSFLLSNYSKNSFYALNKEEITNLHYWLSQPFEVDFGEPYVYYADRSPKYWQDIADAELHQAIYELQTNQEDTDKIPQIQYYLFYFCSAKSWRSPKKTQEEIELFILCDRAIENLEFDNFYEVLRILESNLGKII